MANKGNPVVRNFLILGMVLGFGIVALDQIGEIDARSLIPSGFNILSVETDPTTGAILGNLVLGRPETSGVFITKVTTSRVQCSLSDNALRSELDSSRYISWRVILSNFGACNFGYAEWDLSEIPDDFTSESIQLKLLVDTIPSGAQNLQCKIGIIEQPFDTIATGTKGTRLFNPDQILVEGDWCRTTGIKTFFLDDSAIQAFERAIKGDDKFLLAFSPSSRTESSGGGSWNADGRWWATNGAFTLNGFAKPLSCETGFQQVQFNCEPLVCETGFRIDGNICSAIVCPTGSELIGNDCKEIQCNIGEQLIGNFCTQIICPLGTTLIGNGCDPIICQEGFTLSGNECTAINCPVGNELIGSQCLQIQCPVGTFLQGNDCPPILCTTGTFLVGNQCQQIVCDAGSTLVGDICKPIQCQIGERLVGSDCELITCETGTKLIGNDCELITCLPTEELQGNQCVPKPLECPAGTVEQQNICVQFLPQLQATGAPTNFLTVAGLGILLISFGAFVFRAIRLRGF